MKTLTDIQASEKLGVWLARALKGEDIGIVHSGTGEIVALRPVKVHAEDSALLEYGLTQKELQNTAKKVDAEIERARKSGKLKKFV